MLIAHITDLHVVTPDQLCYDKVATNDQLREAIKSINALQPKPDIVVAGGDLVDHGYLEEYQALRDILAELEMPIYLIPGNHDERSNFLQTFPDSAYLPGPDAEFIHYVVDTESARLICLDTVTPGERHGTLCEARLNWLDEQLSIAPHQPTLIFMHHPPFKTGLHCMDIQGLDNPEDFEAIILRHAQVKGIACGHIHRFIQTQIGTAMAFTSPSTCHQVALNLTPNHSDEVDLVLEPCAIGLLYYMDGKLLTHISYVADHYEQFRPYSDTI